MAAITPRAYVPGVAHYQPRQDSRDGCPWLGRRHEEEVQKIDKLLYFRDFKTAISQGNMQSAIERKRSGYGPSTKEYAE
jgi:hypothetical protein